MRNTRAVGPPREVGQRPWPGIAGPWRDFCSWAYRGRWPWGRMEVKYLNGMCPKWAHATAGAQGGGDEGVPVLHGDAAADHQRH